MPTSRVAEEHTERRSPPDLVYKGNFPTDIPNKILSHTCKDSNKIPIETIPRIFPWGSELDPAALKQAESSPIKGTNDAPVSADLELYSTESPKDHENEKEMKGVWYYTTGCCTSGKGSSISDGCCFHRIKRLHMLTISRNQLSLTFPHIQWIWHSDLAASMNREKKKKQTKHNHGRTNRLLNQILIHVLIRGPGTGGRNME